jgi:hypothetical protein
VKDGRDRDFPPVSERPYCPRYAAMTAGYVAWSGLGVPPEPRRDGVGAKTGGETPALYLVVAQGTLFALYGYYPVYENPLAHGPLKVVRRAERATGDPYWGVTVYFRAALARLARVARRDAGR